MTVRLAAATATALGALALAGCSSGSSGSTSGAPPSAASVARQLGCTGITQTSPVTYYAHDEVDATCGGHHADIATFTTDTARDSWVQFVRQTGGTVTTGNLYAVGTGY